MRARFSNGRRYQVDLSLSEEELTRKAYLYILRKQSIREHSVTELRNKLEGFGYPAHPIESALELAQSQGYQSDVRAKQSLERLALATRRGQRWIHQKSKERGLNTTQTEKSDSEITGDPETKKNALKDLREYVQRKYPNLNVDLKSKKKAQDFLLRRGFRYDEIKQVLRESTEEE